MTRLLMTSVPELSVTVPLRTSSTAFVPALVTSSRPPSTRTLPLAVQAKLPRGRLPEIVLVPADTVEVPTPAAGAGANSNVGAGDVSVGHGELSHASIANDDDGVCQD